jgi:hypothetical protein
MRPSVQTSYRRYGKFLGRARLIRIPSHLVLQTVDLPSYLTYGIRIGIWPPEFGHFECMCRCSGYRGILVHLVLGPFIGPTSAQGRNNDRSSTEKTLMRRRLMRRTTAKRPRARRPPHELFLVRRRTTSTSARHVSVLSKKIRAEDCVSSTLPLIGRRPAFTVPA